MIWIFSHSGLLRRSVTPTSVASDSIQTQLAPFQHFWQTIYTLKTQKKNNSDVLQFQLRTAYTLTSSLKLFFLEKKRVNDTTYLRQAKKNPLCVINKNRMAGEFAETKRQEQYKCTEM